MKDKKIRELKEELKIYGVELDVDRDLMTRLRSEKRTLQEKFESLKLETKELKRKLLEKEALEEKNEALEKEVKELKDFLNKEGFALEEVEEEVDCSAPGLTVQGHPICIHSRSQKSDQVVNNI